MSQTVVGLQNLRCGEDGEQYQSPSLSCPVPSQDADAAPAEGPKVATDCSPRASSLSSVSLASLNSVGLIFSQRWYRSCKHGEKGTLTSPLADSYATLGLALHLYELAVALAGGGAIVVLQELSQQGHALLHFLDCVHPLGHLLCPLLVLQTPPESRPESDEPISS